MTRFKGKPAIDPATNLLVKDGSGQVYAVTDTAFATPLEVTDTAGLPLATISTGPLGIHQDFDTTADHMEVVWKSGPYTVTLESSEGIAAAAAAGAAQPAADAAAAETEARLTSTFVNKAEAVSVNDATVNAVLTDPASAASASLSATYGRSGGVIADGLVQTMREGLRSLRLCIVGDSTANSPDEWFHLMLVDLAAAFPAYTVRERVWDTTLDGYAPAATIQTGTGGEPYLMFNGPGVASSITTPDKATLDVTGDLDLRAKLRPDSWASGANQVILAKFVTDGTRSFRWEITGTGDQLLSWSPDGTAMIDVNAGATIAAGAGDLTVRVTLDVDNGAGGSTITFYTSTDDGQTWTVLATKTSSTTSVYASTADLEVGARANTASVFKGRMYWAEVRNGIDGPVVAAPSAVEHTRTGTTFEDGEGNVWAVPAGVNRAGSPALMAYNASVPGDAPSHGIGRLARTTAAAMDLLFVSYSHNNGALVVPLQWEYEDFASQALAAHPATGMVYVTQNPKLPGADREVEHATRNAQIRAFATANGYGLVDAYRAFVTDPRPLTDLVATDGVHPTAAGSRLWADTATAWLLP